MGGYQLMVAADIVCLTTVTPDPLPRAILEGMAAGRPVVSFRSGGAGEMVVDGETGILVECGDVMGLSRGITLLARDVERRAALGEAGLRRARAQFSLSKHVESMEEVLSAAADQILLR
jgi:glycosyltransferase involved in cell wall biosynthesis